jgi:hypothetical protein
MERKTGMRTDRPGYQSRKNRDGTLTHYWNPKRAVKAAPSYLTMVRLDDHLTDAEIVAECQRRTAELRADLHAKGQPAKYDGTIKSLIDCYRTDKTSSFQRVKHSTRIRDYEPSLRVLETVVGARRIDALRASDFRRWFDGWKQKGHRRATGAIKLLRVILSYGAGERLPGCAQAREILSVMQFDLPPPRKVAMTYDQCLAIIRQSAVAGYPSVGFVEAVKFETGLRRIDVIGEWSPDTDDKEAPFKWRGMSHKDLSRELILTLKTSKTGAEVARDLKVMPLVTEALKAYRVPDLGPVVICEDTGKPWWENRYTTRFRAIRDAAGVPDTVWSMDTRAGAVTETISATGSIEDARELAAHTTAKMTMRYARGDGLESSRRVAKARALKRSEKLVDDQQ